MQWLILDKLISNILYKKIQRLKNHIITSKKVEKTFDKIHSTFCWTPSKRCLTCQHKSHYIKIYRQYSTKWEELWSIFSNTSNRWSFVLPLVFFILVFTKTFKKKKNRQVNKKRRNKVTSIFKRYDHILFKPHKILLVCKSRHTICHQRIIDRITIKIQCGEE